MTLQDFELLCALNASRSFAALEWSGEQVALICEACTEKIFEESNNGEFTG